MLHKRRRRIILDGKKTHRIRGINNKIKLSKQSRINLTEEKVVHGS